MKRISVLLLLVLFFNLANAQKNNPLLPAAIDKTVKNVTDEGDHFNLIKQ